MHAVQQQFWAVRDYLSPVLKESKFKEHGRITPEEFVAAGDFLAYKFPVWSWEKGDSSKTRDFLPPEKQYLITHGVPCLRRATSLTYTDADEDAERLLSFGDSSNTAAGEEWVETHAGRNDNTINYQANPGVIADIPDIDGATGGIAGLHVGDASSGGAAGGAGADTPDMDDIPDMEEDLEGEIDEATAAPVAPKAVPSKTVQPSETETARNNLLSVRTYDVMITYDKYYQTPRIWLIGYDENGTALTPTQIFQDVSADHAFKTVTIEPFPHSATLQAASVHPCKHANVMKRVIERMNAGVVEEQRRLQASSSSGSTNSTSKDGKKKWGFRRVVSGKDSASSNASAGADDDEGMRVDFYLVVFLKFIASIVPTIEVDSTTAF